MTKNLKRFGLFVMASLFMCSMVAAAPKDDDDRRDPPPEPPRTEREDENPAKNNGTKYTGTVKVNKKGYILFTTDDGNEYVLTVDEDSPVKGDANMRDVKRMNNKKAVVYGKLNKDSNVLSVYSISEYSKKVKKGKAYADDDDDRVKSSPEFKPAPKTPVMFGDEK